MPTALDGTRVCIRGGVKKKNFFFFASFLFDDALENMSTIVITLVEHFVPNIQSSVYIFAENENVNGKKKFLLRKHRTKFASNTAKSFEILASLSVSYITLCKVNILCVYCK